MLILLDTVFGIERHLWAWGIGTAFALAALLLSSWLLYQTYYHNNNPPVRFWIMMVILMVPVYSVCAWLGLVLKGQSPYWDLVRACYEAVAIWAFFEFLTAFLGGRQHLATIMREKPPLRHLFPFCWLPKWQMSNGDFYHRCRFWIVQYVPIQLVCSIITFITSLTGQYQEGDFNPDNAYIYIAFVVNCSQIAALYGLVEFYQAMKPELVTTRPLYKFLCIKLIVFFTFWQSVLLSLLVFINVITPTVTYTTDQESYGIDDFIVCIEMLGFAIGHMYAFPYKEFEQENVPIEALRITREEGAQTVMKPDPTDERTYQLAESKRKEQEQQEQEQQPVDYVYVGGTSAAVPLSIITGASSPPPQGASSPPPQGASSTSSPSSSPPSELPPATSPQAQPVQQEVQTEKQKSLADETKVKSSDNDLTEDERKEIVIPIRAAAAAAVSVVDADTRGTTEMTQVSPSTDPGDESPTV